MKVVAESMHKVSLRLVAKACSHPRPWSVDLTIGRDLVLELTLHTMCHTRGPRQGSRYVDFYDSCILMWTHHSLV